MDVAITTSRVNDVMSDVGDDVIDDFIKIDCARGKLPEEHLFEVCAQACPALGMPRGSLTQRQLAHEYP